MDKRIERVENQVAKNAEDLQILKSDVRMINDRLPVLQRDIDFVLDKVNRNERELAHVKMKVEG
ncbi:hypothetical protein [Ammoniphilus resinae]|nr:hypothetical protein [Ammoniphilus resinae]